MIDYKDLQIGNKVKYKDDIVDIAFTHLTGYVGILGAFKSMIVSVKCEEIEPIEVTEQLIEKIGFHRQEIFMTKLPSPWFISSLNEFNIRVDNDSTCKDKRWSCQIDDDKELLGCFDFQYLHELQNGIRLVTKKDLELCL